MTEDPQGKKEYSDTETLKEGRGKLERKPKPQKRSNPGRSPKRSKARPNPNERKPIMKMEYTQPNTLKDAKASLKKAETLKTMKPRPKP